LCNHYNKNTIIKKSHKFLKVRKLKLGAPQNAQNENGGPHFARPYTPCTLTKTTTEQNRRQKVFNGGLYVCAGGLGIRKFEKNSTIHSVSYFNFGGLEFCLGGISPTNSPCGDGTA